MDSFRVIVTIVYMFYQFIVHAQLTSTSSKEAYFKMFVTIPRCHGDPTVFPLYDKHDAEFVHVQSASRPMAFQLILLNQQMELSIRRCGAETLLTYLGFLHFYRRSRNTVRTLTLGVLYRHNSVTSYTFHDVINHNITQSLIRYMCVFFSNSLKFVHLKLVFFNNFKELLLHV